MSSLREIQEYYTLDDCLMMIDIIETNDYNQSIVQDNEERLDKMKVK